SAKCTNEENYALMKFARSVLQTNNVDHCARLCHASTVVGLAAAFGSGAMTNSIPECDIADCFLVTGSNTLEDHPLIGSRIVRAKERGAKLVVVDPREVPMAKFADLFIKVRPGTDVAWLNAMANVIIAENLHDIEFVSGRTEGFEAFARAVAEYPAERGAEICGVRKEQIVEAARMYARAERAMIFYAMGITQHTTGVDNVRAVANLAMLTGNIGREGTGVNPLRGQNNVQGACDMGALPNVLSGYQSVSDETMRRKFGEAWGGPLPSAPGLTVVEMMEAAFRGELKALYVMGENPMVSDPDVNHVREALKRLELLVVQDIFPSDTARLAHVVLAGASYAEKEGTFTNTDRRVQRVRQALPPVGQSKADWLVIRELAGRMGSKGFDWQSPSEIMDEIARLTPIYGGVSHRRLDEGAGLIWPCPTRDDLGTPCLHKDTFSRGKGVFAALAWREAEEKTDSEYPLVLTTGRILFHYHTGTMTRRIAALDNEVKTGFVEMNPKDASPLGVSDGDMVRLRSRRGEIDIGARVTNMVREGVVFVPFHFAECAANVLTNSALDPEAKIPEFKVCAVSVAKKKPA
ncbi:MAG: formate dehydrogenase subunit alpha, partial [Planctomycetota bacterium]|nr:formate dehydrogenase subunit alpha [Planctomycetota bacterium]